MQAVHQTREGALAEERPIELGGLGNLSVDDSVIFRMWHSCVCEKAADSVTNELLQLTLSSYDPSSILL